MNTSSDHNLPSATNRHMTLPASWWSLLINEAAAAIGLRCLSSEQQRRWNRITGVMLVVGILLSIIVFGAMWGVFLSARGYVDYVEGLVLFHEVQASQGTNIYAPEFREAPPYSIPLYGPIFYYVVGGLLGPEPSLLPGRLVSTFSLLGLCGISGWLLYYRSESGLIVMLAGAVPWLVLMGPLQFGVNNRVDSMSVFFAALAVTTASSTNKHIWLWSPLLLLLAGFTKPTAIMAAAPTIFLLHWVNDNKARAITTGLVSLVGATLIVLIGDWSTAGNFSRSIIWSNMNPWSWDQAQQLTQCVCRQPLLPIGVLLALPLLAIERSRPFAIYTLLACATSVFAAGKVGSNTNYFIEVSWSACLCWGFALAQIRNHPRAAAVTGLTAALIIHAALRVQGDVGRTAQGMADWHETEKVITRYASQAPVLTMETGALVLNGFEPYIADPHIIARLAEAGQFDDLRILEDLRANRFSALVVDKDISPSHLGHSNWRQSIRENAMQCYAPSQRLESSTVYLPKRVIAQAHDSERR